MNAVGIGSDTKPVNSCEVGVVGTGEAIALPPSMRYAWKVSGSMKYALPLLAKQTVPGVPVEATFGIQLHWELSPCLPPPSLFTRWLLSQQFSPDSPYQYGHLNRRPGCPPLDGYNCLGFLGRDKSGWGR